MSKDLKILLLGAGGQVGREVVRAAEIGGTKIVALSRAELDFADHAAFAKQIVKGEADVVINAAAYTQVDRAESNPKDAFQVNAIAPGQLAKVCAANELPLIHISTDYVFSGDKLSPYFEGDEPGPINVYGQSKLAGEQAVVQAGGPHAIIRTSWVYSSHGNNFLRTMLRLAATRREINVVSDQYGSPTSAADLAGALLQIAQALSLDRSDRLQGTFHFQGGGSATWYEFAAAIMNNCRTWNWHAAHINAVPTSSYPTPAKRPRNSRLDCAKILATHGIAQRPWQHSLADVMADLARGGSIA